MIAGPEQALTGSTEIAFGRSPSDEREIYVTANVGMSLPPENGVEAGKIIRIALDQKW